MVKYTEIVLDNTKESLDNPKLPKDLIKHRKHRNMYYLRWEDGVISEDFYNLSRAKNFLRVLKVEGTEEEPKNSRKRGYISKTKKNTTEDHL